MAWVTGWYSSLFHSSSSLVGGWWWVPTVKRGFSRRFQTKSYFHPIKRLYSHSPFTSRHMLEPTYHNSYFFIRHLHNGNTCILNMRKELHIDINTQKCFQFQVTLQLPWQWHCPRSGKKWTSQKCPHMKWLKFQKLTFHRFVPIRQHDI